MPAFAWLCRQPRPAAALCAAGVAALLCGCVVSNPDFCAADGDCGPGGQCDTAANRCVDTGGDSCRSDAECAANAPVCDPDQLTCRACAGPDAAGDAECAAIDGTVPVCTGAGACAECRGAGIGCDAADAPVCAPETAACRGCVADAECLALDAGADRCAPSGQCVECLDSADCASGVCDPSTNACVGEASVVYVATDGQDGTACGSRQDPCATVASPVGALDKVSGERAFVFVAAGDYEEAPAIDATSLQAAAVTLVGDATGTGVAFTPPIGSDSPGLLVDAGKRVAVASVEFVGSQDAGVRCSGRATSLLLSGVRASSNALYGVSVTECSATLERVELRANGQGALELVDATATIIGGELTGNLAAGAGAIDQAGGELEVLGARFGSGSVQVQNGELTLSDAVFDADAVLDVSIGSDAIVADTQLAGGLVGQNALSLAVRDSTIEGCASAEAQAALTWLGRLSSPTSDLEVERSVLRDCRKGGLVVTDSNFRIDNNIIVENGAGDSGVGGVSIDNSQTPAATQLFRHNTIANNQAVLDAEAAGMSCKTSTAMTADSNIVFFAGGGAPVIGGDCGHEFSLIEGGFAGDGNSDQVPQFVNAPNGDFRLLAGSPGIDVANPSSAVTDDIDGDARPQGAGFDIGADEVTP